MRDTLTAPPSRTQVPLRHLTSAHALDRPLIEQLLEGAAAFERDGSDRAPLRGRLLATLFYEPSTRTRFSFEAAMYRLGGQVLSAENAAGASSAAKGESLEDTIRVVTGYADAIVLPHPPLARSPALPFSGQRAGHDLSGRAAHGHGRHRSTEKTAGRRNRRFRRRDGGPRRAVPDPDPGRALRVRRPVRALPWRLRRQS